jgi:hypothetical protein
VVLCDQPHSNNMVLLPGLLLLGCVISLTILLLLLPV